MGCKISDFSDWMVGFRGVFCGFSGGEFLRVFHCGLRDYC